MEDREIFFENHPEPMFIFDRATLRFLAVNNAAIAKYGYSQDEFLAMTIADIRPAEDVPRLREIIAAKTTGLDKVGVFRHRLKSGDLIEVDVTTHHVRYKKRDAELAVLRDVTDLRAAELKAQDAVKREANLFKALFDSLPGKFMVLSVPNHTIVAASDAYLAAAGTLRAEVIGRCVFDVFPGDPTDPSRNSKADTLASLKRVAANRVPDVMALQAFATRRPASAGGGIAEHCWSVVNTPVLDVDGSVAFVILRVEELTELVRIGVLSDQKSLKTTDVQAPQLQFGLEMMRRSKELRIANENLQIMATNLRTAERLLKIGFWQMNVDTGSVVWSDTMYEICGVARQDFSPTLKKFQSMVHPDDREKVQLNLSASATSDNPSSSHLFRFLRPSGETIWVRVATERAQISQGQVINGTLQDVTAHVLAETKLRDADAMERMAARLAHLGGWRIDLAPRKVTWSDETAEIHGAPPGTSPAWEEALNYIAPEYRDEVIRIVDKCARDGTHFDEVIEIIARTGKRVWVRTTGDPEIGPDGAIAAIKGAFQDISEFVAVREKSNALARRLAQTLENMGEAFTLVDSEWRYTFVNAQAERILNHSRSDLLGKVIWDAFPDARTSLFRTECERALATGKLVRFESYYADPLNIWFEVGAHPTADGLAIYFRDVTADRAKTEQLRLLQLSVAHLNDMVVITEAEPLDSPDGPKIVYVNDAFVRTTGYPREVAIGGTPRMLQGKNTSRDELARIGTALRAKQAVKADLINYTSKGQPYWVEVTINPVLDANGVVTHLVSVQRDITERKAAEQTLRLSEERFRLVSNASRRVIWDYDFATETSWFNDNLEKSFGYSPSVDTPRNFQWDDHIHPEDRQRVRAKLDAAIKGTDLTWKDEYRILRANGEAANVKDNAALIRDASGRALRMVGSFEDVTKEHEEADRRRQSLKLETMGQLTGGVAHDFNNLLTIILGNSEALAESLADEKQRELAVMTVRASERAASLCRQLLAFARKQPLEPRPVGIDEQIDSVNSILKRAVSERVEIRHERTDGLWLTELDANQLEVSLLNLAINARDAMPDGGVLLIKTCNFETATPIPVNQGEVPPGQYVMVSLTDTGSGMSPRTLERVFEPFFSTKPAGMGSGLGLSMVYGFVAQSGGYIQLQSEIGTGTTCNLYFPRSLAVATAQLQPQPQSSVAGGNEHILVVEDDRFVREHLVGQLFDLGYQVSVAANASDAMAIIRTQPFLDLLFTDIMMPGDLNGRELADTARCLRPGLKVLFASGYTENTLIQDGRLEKGVTLLTKPFRRKEMARKVRSVLDAPV